MALYTTSLDNTLDRALLPPATKLGQGYVFTGACDSVNRGRGVHHTPRSRHPPRADPPEQTPPLEQTPRSRHPPEQTPQSRPPWSKHPPSRHPHPPLAVSMLSDTVNARAVRILLECNLVIIVIVSDLFQIDGRSSLLPPLRAFTCIFRLNAVNCPGV